MPIIVLFIAFNLSVVLGMSGGGILDFDFELGAPVLIVLKVESLAIVHNDALRYPKSEYNFFS